MVKLVIVDDEKTTRDSLARYIPWKALNVESVRTARNGLEALALCEQDPPDLLITDVRMPKMDGLQLAETVRQRYPRCKIVFLSGYADKQYLKKAISLQAVSYIEKPVDPDEVQQVTRAALGLLREEAARRQEAERIRAAALDGESLVREQIARSLVAGLVDPETLRQTYGSAIPSITPESYCTASVLTLGWSRTQRGGQKEAMREQILRASRDRCPFSLPTSFLGSTDGETIAVILAGRIVEESPRSRGAFQELLETLKRLSSGRFTVSAGVGQPVKDLRGLPESYEAARRAAALSFYRGPWTVVFAGAGRREKLSPGADTLALFQEALEEDDAEQAVALVKQLAQRAAEQESSDIDSVRNAFFRLLLAAVEVAWSRKIANPFGDEERHYFWQEIREQESLAGLAGFIETNIQAMFAGEAPGTRSSRKIAEIRRYIRGSFSQPDLCLQSIADHSGLSRTYLSYLFKQATGSNLNEYITRLRIDKARRLLLDPRMKSYEVAAKVGYPDASYFSTIFRKHVGLSPSEYREKGLR